MNALTSYLLFSLFLIALTPKAAHGQRARVSNVRVELDATRAKILYDVADNLPTDSIFINVESSGRGRLNARTVTGDAGKGVTPGHNKTIYWDYRLDGITITDKEQIRITVSVDRVRAGGGPANALVSVLLPGVGNILVQPNRQIGLRPLITVGYAGLLTYGLIQRGRSNRQYERYTAQLSALEAEPFYQESARLRRHYLVSTRAAAAVLVADVVYTFLKGRRNRQPREKPQVVLNYLGHTAVAGVQFTF
ncbi:hypothetical protein GCM10023189_38340 [Nibrella saemangeumensis]|uniref:DUF5683 domain-containing protein n=1 Tax=Nibrella saemangeumensis TaxID=1084526 RepID=A0ABP8N6C8_9BACT